MKSLALQQQQQLDQEEFIIQQRRRQLDLQTQIDIASAEEGTYAAFSWLIGMVIMSMLLILKAVIQNQLCRFFPHAPLAQSFMKNNESHNYNSSPSNTIRILQGVPLLPYKPQVDPVTQLINQGQLSKDSSWMLSSDKLLTTAENDKHRLH